MKKVILPAKTMRALTVTAAGGLSVVEASIPKLGPAQILVEMKFSAVNGIDVEIQKGGWRWQAKQFRRKGPAVTGFELAGVARTDGARIRSGQRVIGYSPILNGSRTHAEFVAMDERDLQALPDDLEDDGAAALVAMGLTAIDILERLKPLKAGDRCLVVGAAGGVGVYALQMALQQGALTVSIASEANVNWLRSLGAHEVRSYQDGEMWRSKDQFDLVIDTPAVSSFAEAAPYLTPQGMYVSTNPQQDVMGFVRAAFSSKRAGYLMLTRSNPVALQRLIDLASRGALKPTIDSIHDIEEASTAFDRFAVRGKQGRVLLRM